MPDVIAEQGALQDAIESPSTSVSRLGAAGWMKGKVADLNAIGVTENVSRLAAAGRIMGGIYDADPLATSTFYAPLLTTLVLTRGTGNPTYTRATTAYVTDFEGLLKQVPSGCARFTGARVGINYIANSEVPTKVGSVTLTSGQTDPLGGTAAYKVDFAATGGGNRVVYSTRGDHPVGITGNISVWMRGEVGGEQVKLWDGWVVDAVTHTLTTIWKRYTYSFTTSSSISVMIYATAGTPTIYTAFAQGEASGSAIPYEYVSVGVLSAPYHGAGVDGVKYFDTENGNTVNSGIVTEAAGAAIADATLKGYFAEGQRQNRCLYSQDFTNAAWVSGGGGIAVTPNTAVAPDGTTTADTLTASGANGTLIQDLGVVASAAKAGGMWLKRKTGTGNIDLTLDGGSTWTTVAVTSSWLLLEKTQTLANEDFGIRIVTSGDAVYAWQGQVETVASATAKLSSVIPTTTAAVTRNYDLLYYPSTGNMPEYSWTTYCEIERPVGWGGTSLPHASPIAIGSYAANASICLGGYGGSTNGAIAYFGTIWSLAKNYTAQLPLGARNKVAYIGSADGATFSNSANGSVVESGTASPVKSANWNAAYIGIGNFWEGHANNDQNLRVRNLRIWNKALPDATLESITTP